MAGSGYKAFAVGEVLTAADVNNYLQQQTVMVFASAAARTTALAAVLAEGMVTYLKDTDVVEIYTGASWVSLDDPNAIQNSIVTAKGDLISATGSSTPSRLAVGTNGQVLKANSATATGLEWGTASGGSLTSGGASVLTKQNTTSASFTDLATVGPAVTLTTGTKALVMWSCVVDNNTADRGTYTSVAVSGATTLAASTDYQTDLTGSSANRPYITVARSVLLTGLTAGSNTFTVKYATENTTTGNFSKRYIAVVDMGS